MQRFILVAVLACFASGPASAHAQGMLYKWVDSRGVAHYTNTPTSSNAKSVDDALPPAANFKRPTPPVEAAKEAAKPATGDSATPATTPSEDTPRQASGEPAPALQQPTTDNQQPEPSTTQANQ